MTLGALETLSVREGWTWEPLWAVAPRVKEYGGAGLRPLSVYLEAGVVPRDSRDDNHNQLGDDLSRYLIVRPGDIVFNKLRTWQGGLGVSQYEGIVSPAYYVCRPKAGVEPRFLHYLLRSPAYLAELSRRSKWMPPSQFDIPWDVLRTLPILIPPLSEQRRVVAFLDREIFHIGRMADVEVRLREHLEERISALPDNVVERLASNSPNVPLRRFVTKVDQGVSPQCDAVPASDGEWGVLKVSALRPRMFLPQENKRLSDTKVIDVSTRVEAGDLLVTRANTPDLVGSTAVVPHTSQDLFLSDKIFRVGLVPDLDPNYVALVAAGGRIRTMCAAASHGASQSMANLRFEEIKRWPIPLVSLDEQRKAVFEVECDEESLIRIRARIDQQLRLLAERRTALITAAVNGEFDVSSASGRGVTDGLEV